MKKILSVINDLLINKYIYITLKLMKTMKNFNNLERNIIFQKIIRRNPDCCIHFAINFTKTDMYIN